jgi:hypothetical protein
MFSNSLALFREARLRVLDRTFAVRVPQETAASEAGLQIRNS